MSRLVDQFFEIYPTVLLQDRTLYTLREGKSKRGEEIENTTLDPDSYEAWYEEDKTGPDSDIVRVGNFTWHRKKSNENITDIGEIKGFSFFYARYAFNDKKRKTVLQKNGRNRTIARISKEVFCVIDTKDERNSNLTRIITAWKIVNKFDQWIRFYFQGQEHIKESIREFGKPIYPGASDEQSEIYFKEAWDYIDEERRAGHLPGKPTSDYEGNDGDEIIS